MTTGPETPSPEEVMKVIIKCDYYPKDIAEADMKDYLAKEKNNEDYFASVENIDIIHERMKSAEQLFIDGALTERINKNLIDYGIEPDAQTMLDVNEELSMFRIRQSADVIKELKAKFQVDKYRLLNTFRDKEVLKTYTNEQIKNAVLSMWHLKDCIEKMEEQLRGWEDVVKQRYHADD